MVPSVFVFGMSSVRGLWFYHASTRTIVGVAGHGRSVMVVVVVVIFTFPNIVGSGAVYENETRLAEEWCRVHAEFTLHIP